MKQNEVYDFGELAFDSTIVVNKRTNREEEVQGPTEYGPRYAEARENASNLIKKFGLVPDDFWIKKQWNWREGKVVYENLIVSHGGCEIIHSKLPKEKKFDPDAVEEGKGVDGGVVLFYRSKEQGIFEVGEASARNNSFSFVYNIAKNRLFNKVVLKNVGALGIYGEDEAEDFARYSNVSARPAPSAPVPQPVQHPQPAAQPQHGPDFIGRIERLKQAVAFTETNEQKMLASFGASCYEDLTEEALANAEGVLGPRVHQKKRMMLKEAEIASGASLSGQSAPTQQPPQMPEGLSPVAQMMMAQANANTVPAEAPALEPAEVPLGQTVYSCLAGSPEQFEDMNGQTLDQIGKEMLKPLFGRKNAFGRRYVTAEMLDKIVEYISA